MFSPGLGVSRSGVPWLVVVGWIPAGARTVRTGVGRGLVHVSQSRALGPVSGTLNPEPTEGSGRPSAELPALPAPLN